MPEKVLIVDDDPNVLKAYERRLRKRFRVETALCSEEGVTAVDILGPFAVVVSDMMMPRENGAEFLARILKTAPDSVRIMLTGNADQATATAAINQGRVFRFLNKPCEAETLEQAIADGIEEYRRVTSERELLTKTMGGAVDMLSKVLALANPEAFGRAGRIRTTVAEIVQAADLENSWEFGIAASLSQLGYVAAPDVVLQKRARGERLTPEEQQAIDSHPRVAGELIATIPRLERVAGIVAAQNDEPEGDDLQDPTTVAFGAGLLRLAVEFDYLIHDAAVERPAALAQLESTADRFPAACLEALAEVVGRADERRLVHVAVSQLVDGMTLVEHVETEDGALLVAKGQEVTASLRERLRNYASTHTVREPITVLVAAALAEKLQLAEPAPA